jgi:site-specific DNA-methyltransferase (adenine-specific)
MIDLRLGDCLEILPDLPDKSVDAIITDLPYGTTACSWDTVIPFEPLWAQVKRLLKPRGVFVTTASQPFTSILIMSNLDWFKYELIWNRNYCGSPGLAKYRPMPTHENICIFSQNGHIYNPQMRTGKPYKDIRSNAGTKPSGTNEHKLGYRVHGPVVNNGTRYPQSIIDVQKHNEPGQHPTQKPVTLYEYLILTYTNPGDTVLDPCMGSGTTGVACIKTGRDFIGIELREDYFATLQRRIGVAQQQLTLELV